MNIEINDLLKLLQTKKDLTINQAYAIFLEHIFNSKRIATYKFHETYMKTIIPFYEIEHIEYCSQISNELLFKFISYEKSKNVKNITINKKITHIKYMMNYLHKMDLITKPNITIEKLKDDSARYNIISNQDINKILAAIPNLCDKYKLQILLLITTGIRRTELFKIKKSDVHYEQLYINLSHTKNGKQRNIYINEYIANLIKTVSKDNKIYLFENQQHTDNENADNINNTMKAIYSNTGVKVSPHQLRHAFATNLLEKGYDIETIRLLLGHSDYSMIMRYVHIKNKRLADITTSLYDLELCGQASPHIQNKD